ncbi:hypothetical protein [Nonomuraea sp. NPDC049646]|uniref:hypothetical protein n=1 Tax=unclassified Nonomuraea TaxID=2593643 RepID=UPI0037A566EF
MSDAIREFARRRPVTAAEAVDRLAGQLRDVTAQIRVLSVPAGPRGRLRAAGRLCEQAARQLLAAAGALNSLPVVSRCPVGWGLCPDHGARLASADGCSWCTDDRCQRRWHYDRLAQPCTEPCTHRVIAPTGDSVEMCLGHALRVHDLDEPDAWRLIRL